MECLESRRKKVLDIEKVEVIEATDALGALKFSGNGKPYGYSGVSDPKRIIGAEVLLAMDRAGETANTTFVRAWINGLPSISRRKSPQSPAGMLGGGLITTDRDESTNLIMVEIFGRTWYFRNRMGNINDYRRPDREISEVEFMNMAWRPQ